jgi:hypothetical protein
VHANAHVDITFIINPITPVLLIVIISKRETTAETKTAVIGPKINPPMVIITSLGSYFKNRTTGTLAINTDA